MNNKIIENFELLEKQIIFELENKINVVNNKFRLYAIKKIINIIKNLKYEIKTSKQLENIKNIGDHTLKRIDEILKTGKLSELYLDKNQIKIINFLEKLTDIFGIGPKLAWKIFSENKITSIDELLNALNKNSIKLPPNAIKGLKYINIINTNIPRNEITDFYNYIKNLLYKQDKNIISMVCGSYRREKETSGDFDLIISHQKIKDNTNYHLIKNLVIELKKNNIIIESFTNDDVNTKYMGLYKWNNKIIRIDIRCVPYKSWYTSILYFTGSKTFNENIRLIAKSYNYKLNEYELYNNKTGTAFDINSEEDIFNILKIPYIQPKDR